MPEFRKIEREEVENLTHRPKATGERTRIREQYQSFLADIGEGEGGEVTLADGDNRSTIKNRLKAAAKALGKEIAFIRTSQDVVRFRVGSDRAEDADPSQSQEDATSPEEIPAEAAAPKRSRRRKVTE
jgi:hypothetical protein